MFFYRLMQPLYLALGTSQETASTTRGDSDLSTRQSAQQSDHKGLLPEPDFVAKEIASLAILRSGIFRLKWLRDNDRPSKRVMTQR